MTDKEKVVHFLAGLGVSYTEVQGHAADLYGAWDEWVSERGVREAPFTSYLGVIPGELLIVGRPSTRWPSIVHEAGHLLCDATPLDRKSPEIEWFGWEWAVALYLDLPRDVFLFENRDYGISWESPDERWRDDVMDLRGKEVEQFFGQKFKEAQRLGLVTGDGRPVAHARRCFQAVKTDYREEART